MNQPANFEGNYPQHQTSPTPDKLKEPVKPETTSQFIQKDAEDIGSSFLLHTQIIIK